MGTGKILCCHHGGLRKKRCFLKTWIRVGATFALTVATLIATLISWHLCLGGLLSTFFIMMNPVDLQSLCSSVLLYNIEIIYMLVVPRYKRHDVFLSLGWNHHLPSEWGSISQEASLLVLFFSRSWLLGPRVWSHIHSCSMIAFAETVEREAW